MKKFFFCLVFLITFGIIAQRVSAAGEKTVTSIQMSPGSLPTLKVGDVLNFSVIAKDQNDSFMYSGVTYEWGISSNGSIAQISADQDGRIATIKITGEGQGDMYVIARDQFGNTATKSLQIVTQDNASICNSDINEDMIVDLDDYSIMVNNFLLSNPSNIRADINRDNIVDISDYSIFVRNFFKRCLNF